MLALGKMGGYGSSFANLLELNTQADLINSALANRGDRLKRGFLTLIRA